MLAAEETTVSPETLSAQWRKDNASIEALKAAGSDVTKPHTFEHHFYSTSKGNLENLSNEGKRLGYTVGLVHTTSGQGQDYWYTDLLKDVIPDIKNITQETTLMLNLAGKYGADYDGWSCGVVE